MSTKDFRGALAKTIIDWATLAHPTLPLMWENGPEIDEDKIGSTWLDIGIKWVSAEPRNLGDVYKGRRKGVISLQLFAKEGMGTGRSDDILDELSVLLSHTRVGNAVVGFASRSTPVTALGWYKSGVMLPFALDIVL